MTSILSHVPTLFLHGHRELDDDGDGVQFGYPMKPGETLDEIAASLQIPISELLADNPNLQAGMLLQPGLEISVPSQYLSQIVSNPGLFVAPAGMNGQSGFDVPVSNTAAFVNPNASSYGTSGYSANVILPNSGVSSSNSSDFALGASPSSNLGLPGNYFGNGTNGASGISSVLFGSPTGSASSDPFGLLNALSFLLPQQGASAGYGNMPSWLGALSPTMAGTSAPVLSFAQAAGLMAQTLQAPFASNAPTTSNMAALAVQAALANDPANANAVLSPSAAQAANVTTPTTVTALNSAQANGVVARAGQASEANVTVPNTAQAANNSARTVQAQRDPNLPPPPPMPPAGENRFNAFGMAAPLQNAAPQPSILSAWNAVAGAASGGNQAKLEIMALLATQAGSSMAGGVTAPVGNGQAPGFIDPMALAAYAAAMRGGRTINLGGGRTLQFNVVADRLSRINAIGDEERGASTGTRRTGDGLDGVADDELAEVDEKAQERHEERNRERRRLATVAAMRRRRRPLSTRCRYRQGERRPLRDPGCGRYPRGVDLAEFSSRLPPRYLWTASPRRGDERPDKA